MTTPAERVLRAGGELMARLLSNPDGFSEYNDLLGLFFKGLPTAILGELLRHPNDRVIAGALFIAEELGDKASSLIGDIVLHTKNKDPRIRISAYGAVGSCTTTENEGAFVHVVLGVRDPDPHCRKIATLWMMRVRDTRLKAALRALESAQTDAELQTGLRLLLGEASRDPAQIQAWILDQEPMRRRIGAVAAGRTAHLYPNLLDLAATSRDSEVNACAAAQMQFTALRRGKRERREKA